MNSFDETSNSEWDRIHINCYAPELFRLKIVRFNCHFALQSCGDACRVLRYLVCHNVLPSCWHVCII